MGVAPASFTGRKTDMNNKIIKDVTEAARIKAEIDIKSEELKNEILTSKSDYSEAYGNIYYV